MIPILILCLIQGCVSAGKYAVTLWPIYMADNVSRGGSERMFVACLDRSFCRSEFWPSASVFKSSNGTWQTLMHGKNMFDPYIQRHDVE